MIVCDDCNKKGMVMINPKNMDGHRTDLPTCNFVVGFSVLRRGGLAPELKVNPQCLSDLVVQKTGKRSYKKDGKKIRLNLFLL